MNINGHMLDTMNTFNPFFREKYGFECTLNVVPEIRKVMLFKKVPVDTVQVLSMGKVLFSYDHDPKQYPNEGEPTSLISFMRISMKISMRISYHKGRFRTLKSLVLNVNFQDFGTNFSRHMEVWTNSLSTKVPIK